MLEGGSSDLQTDWRFPSHQYPDSSEYEEAWQVAELAHRAILDEVAVQWVHKGTFPLLTSEQRYWLQLRFLAAARFLYQFALDDGTTVFSFPPMQQSEFFRWLLVDWWAGLKGFQALYYVIELPSTHVASTN